MSAPVILVTGGYDHKIRYWDATSGGCTRTLSFPDSQVNCLQISQDKVLLAAGGNPLLQLFDINSPDDRPLVSYEGYNSNVMALGFQKDRRWLYSSSEDGWVKVWDPRSNHITRKYDCGCAANTVVLHPNETELISGDQSGTLRVWDLQADKCRYETTLEMPIRSISTALDGSFLTVGLHKGRLGVYAMNAQRTPELEREIQAHDDYLLKCLISNDLRYVATTSSDATIKVWNTITWEPEKILTKHQRWVWDCIFSADSMYLLSASSDMSAKLWDLRSGDVVRNYVAQNNTLAFTCVALNDISLS